MSDLTDRLLRAASNTILQSDQSLMREAAKELALLSDPNAVHANMVRGTIANPSIRQILHIYGESEIMKVIDADKMARLKKEFPNV